MGDGGGWGEGKKVEGEWGEEEKGDEDGIDEREDGWEGGGGVWDDEGGVGVGEREIEGGGEKG